MVTFSQIFIIFGGLAIFIFGMQLMSEGLQNVAGQRMRSILRLFAKNRFVAVITGVVITSVVQSSIATTVMSVGFVNAGLLTLQQAIGIILGSHIGTTITGQLVAFKISWIIMPAIIIGVVLNFFTKRTIASWGTIIMGFGFIFLGMDQMGGELRKLSQTETVVNIFRTFCCEPANGIMPFGQVFGAIFIGIVITAVIQSSSVTSGIVIVLAGSGLLDFYTATVIILGANIGTTVTAQIAAIPANRVAKQAAMSHTMAQVIGVILCTLTFWIPVHGEPVFFAFVRCISPGAETGRMIANANTLYNIITTLILLPFVPILAKLCELIIPIKDKDIKFKHLEPHLLATPEIALAQTTTALCDMLKKAWRNVEASLNYYNRNDEKNQQIIQRLDKREADIDARQQEIADYLSELMRHKLTPDQTRQIPMLIHCTNDIERIGDHTFLIKNIFDHLKEQELKFSPKAESEFDSLHKRITDLADIVVNLLNRKSFDLINLAKKMRLDLVVQLNKSETEHMSRIGSGDCIPEVGMMYLELIDEMRKVSRHLANIIDRADNFYDKLPKLENGEKGFHSVPFEEDEKE